MSTSFSPPINEVPTAAQQPSTNGPSTDDASQNLRDQDRERQKSERQQQAQEHTRRWKEQQEARKLQKQEQRQQYTRGKRRHGSSSRQPGSGSWEEQEIARLSQRVLQLEDRLQKARESHRKQIDTLDWQMILQDTESTRQLLDLARKHGAQIKGVLHRMDALSEEFEEGLQE